MPAILDIDQLRAFDSIEPFPPVTSEEEFAVSRAIEHASRLSGLLLAPEGPSDFQDGPAFMCAQEYAPPGRYRGPVLGHVLGGFYFSKYGRLFCGGLREHTSAASAEMWARMKSVIADEHSFRYVPSQLLEQPYDGIFTSFPCSTWSDRLFAPGMTHAGLRPNYALKRTVRRKFPVRSCVAARTAA